MKSRHLDTKDCLSVLSYYNVDIPVEVDEIEKLASELLTTKLCRRINTGFPYQKCKKDKKPKPHRTHKVDHPHHHRKTKKKSM